jgi:hypothetical protein
MPAAIARQYAAASLPMGETTPHRVTTTRCTSGLAVDEAFDRAYEIADGAELDLRIAWIIGNRDVEFLFQLVNDIDGVQ